MRLMLALAAALIATPALATEIETEAQTTAVADAPVATSNGAAPLSTADQIEAFIRSSPGRQTAVDEDLAPGVTPGDDRKVHGEVSVGIGTHGYRNVYARTDLPLGETGRLSIAVEDSRGDGLGRGYYGSPYGGPFGGYGGYGGRSQSVGIGLSLSPQGATDRQRCDLEGATPPRPLDATGGPNGRCVRPYRGW